MNKRSEHKLLHSISTLYRLTVDDASSLIRVPEHTWPTLSIYYTEAGTASRDNVSVLDLGADTIDVYKLRQPKRFGKWPEHIFKLTNPELIYSQASLDYALLELRAVRGQETIQELLF